MPNTLESFETFSAYGILAKAASIPAGYGRVMVDSDGAIKSDKFMTYHELDSYDTELCAKICTSTPGCDSCEFLKASQVVHH